MPDWVTEGFEEYAKRMPPECRLNLVEIPALKRSKNQDLEAIKAREGELILNALSKNDYVVALDASGRQFETEGLAAELKRWMGLGANVSLLIGGPEGLSQACLEKAQCHLSLSKMTFPHPLVRVIIAEQLYRAFSILKGHPYHR